MGGLQGLKAPSCEPAKLAAISVYTDGAGFSVRNANVHLCTGALIAVNAHGVSRRLRPDSHASECLTESERRAQYEKEREEADGSYGRV